MTRLVDIRGDVVLGEWRTDPCDFEHSKKIELRPRVLAYEGVDNGYGAWRVLRLGASEEFYTRRSNNFYDYITVNITVAEMEALCFMALIYQRSANNRFYCKDKDRQNDIVDALNSLRERGINDRA